MSIKLFTKSLVTAAVVVSLLVLFVLSGCSAGDSAPVAEKPKVSVLTVQPQRQALTAELAGRTQAFMVAQIRPQVGGIVQQRLFVEGAEVKAGQALYQIDAAPYKAALAQMQATAAKARATLKSAQSTARRDAQLARHAQRLAVGQRKTQSVGGPLFGCIGTGCGCMGMVRS